MSQEIWTAVDAHFSDQLVIHDEALEAALRASEAAGLPAINVAPNQGKLLHLFAKIHGAKRILEIGTLGGYSTIWMARALPEDGQLVTLEFDPHHAEVATKNIAAAGLSDKVQVRVGAALDTLPMLANENPAPFDIVFIDADKENNPRYFLWALRLTRPGSLIVVDNVVRGGEIVDSESVDPSVIGVREVLEMMGKDPAVDATAIQTVGSKGHDGFAIAIVK